jgi:hypothetical protein
MTTGTVKSPQCLAAALEDIVAELEFTELYSCNRDALTEKKYFPPYFIQIPVSRTNSAVTKGKVMLFQETAKPGHSNGHLPNQVSGKSPF